MLTAVDVLEKIKKNLENFNAAVTVNNQEITFKKFISSKIENEEIEDKVKLNEKELRRMTDILKDSDIDNIEKNKMARTIFKEITKGGSDGKHLKFVFWKD